MISFHLSNLLRYSLHPRPRRIPLPSSSPSRPANIQGTITERTYRHRDDCRGVEDFALLREVVKIERYILCGLNRAGSITCLPAALSEMPCQGTSLSVFGKDLHATTEILVRLRAAGGIEAERTCIWVSLSEASSSTQPRRRLSDSTTITIYEAGVLLKGDI